MVSSEQLRAVGRPYGSTFLSERMPSWLWHLGEWAGNGLILALFFVLIGLPLSVVLLQAIMPALFDPLHPTFGIDLSTAIRAFGEPRLVASILNSLLLAGCVSVSATTLGAFYAFSLHRTDIPFKRFLQTVPWLVFLTPVYLKGLAWVLLMSPGGYLSQLGVMPQFVSDAFFGASGLIFVHTFNLFPLPYFVLTGALAGLGSEFEDAARLSGAGLRRVWLQINMPLLLPAIALCVIAVYAEVLSDFGLASTIARLSGFTLLTYGIYVAASAYPVDFALAGSQALILLCLVAAIVLADRLLRRQNAARLISGRARRARVYKLGAWRRVFAGLGILIALLALVFPILAIVLRSLCRTLSAGLVAENLTLDFLQQAANIYEPSNQALVRSLVFAFVTASMSACIALFLAMRLDNSNKLLKPMIIGIALSTVAIPGIVLGFGYILVWNRLPVFSSWPFPRYGDASLLVTGYIGTALPYCLVIIMTAVGQLSPSLTDAARLHGIGWARRALSIILPLVMLSVMTAFLFTFIRTVFELPMSELLIPVNGPAAPSAIIRLFGKDDEGMGSALSLLAMCSVSAISILVWLVIQKFIARPNIKAVQLTALPLAIQSSEGVT
ncbi:MAG: iron ABC transporter permease [Pseudomonadota bacterium]|nr:iron ABC transporter permease [Pseudomonadota bacterium]